MEMVGLGIIAACMFIGVTVGSVLARLLGLTGDVGGVGFAMLLLVLLTNYVKFDQRIKNGMQFMSDIYIPIIVAMAAIQNVRGAIGGGMVAFLAGGIAVVASLAIVPLIDRIGKTKANSGGVGA